MEGLVIHQLSTSASLRSRVPPWRICRDMEDGSRPPITERRFESAEEAEKWLTKEWVPQSAKPTP